VSPNPEVVRSGLPSMPWVPVDDVLDQAIGSDDPGLVAEAVAALELLARLLTPRAPRLSAPAGSS
jgi:hypothetical protein